MSIPTNAAVVLLSLWGAMATTSEDNSSSHTAADVDVDVDRTQTTTSATKKKKKKRVSLQSSLSSLEQNSKALSSKVIMETIEVAAINTKTKTVATTNAKSKKSGIGRSTSNHVSILESSTEAAATTTETITNNATDDATRNDNIDNNDPNHDKRNSLQQTKKKTMTEMVHEAIVALKDRTGSSQPAILKYILATWPQLVQDTPSFRSRVLVTLKKGTAAQHFSKTKASYRISAEWNKKTKHLQKQKQLRRLRAAAAASAAATLKAAGPKEEEDDDAVTEYIIPDANTSNDSSQEQLEERLMQQSIKETLEQKRKEKVERLKRRRFPIEDTRLHEEDYELGLPSTSSNLNRCHASIPYFFQLTRDSKTSAQLPSRCDAMDVDTRGLVPDLLQVYHFFSGDVRFCDIVTDHQQLSCDFSARHLVYAVDEIIVGNAKKSKLIPPLIQHLFLCCLSILTAPNTTMTQTRNATTTTAAAAAVDFADSSVDATASTSQLSREQLRLHLDLQELREALSPTSWPEVCCMYMECMDRYYKSGASQDPTVLAPGVTNLDYLFRITNTATPTLNPNATTTNAGSASTTSLPMGYHGYLGHEKSILYKAFVKLNRQLIWTLQADEIMVLLRALVDDVIATHPLVMMEISNREEKLAALARDKRAADANYRKVKLGCDGPSKKPLSKRKDDDNVENDEYEKGKKKSNKKDEKKKNGKDAVKEPEGVAGDKLFKPTATKKQFEQAKREQLKANEEYDHGLRTLVSRTEPIGYDRHFNRYYSFFHDPQYIFIEMNRSVTTTTEHLPPSVQQHKTIWHVIDKVSILNHLASNLDVRGYREKALYDVLVGTTTTDGDAPTGNGLKRFLQDDVKEKDKLADYDRELQQVKNKLEEVRLNIIRLEEEEGRRPSRFQSDLVMELESQVFAMETKIANASIADDIDYMELTGLDALRKFENKVKRHSKRSKSDHCVLTLPCLNLIPNGSSKSNPNVRTGIVGMIVDEMLYVEELCQDLVPWEDKVMRESWIVDLEKLAVAWIDSCTFFLGPEVKALSTKVSRSDDVVTPSMSSPEGRRDSVESTIRLSSGGGKRQRMDSPLSGVNQLTLTQIISQAKQPLLDLEERIYQVSGLAMADRDQDIADDNMSDADEGEATEEELERQRSKAWKKKAYIIKLTPAKRPSLIRETLVEAIAAARNAHLGQVVAQLRSALLLFHPVAAGECKQAVVAILEEHGGYDQDADDDDDEDESKADDDGDESKTPTPSNLCFEAVSLFGSLGDDDKATRADWTDAVRQCKSLTRFAALSTAFCRKATSILDKLQLERKSLTTALEKWQREDERMKHPRPGKKNNRKMVEPPTEMWANVDYTNELCMVRLENHPWWPAKKCIAKDQSLQESLDSFDRVLVAMVGEHGELRCVKNEDARVFTGSALDEYMEEYSKEDRVQLEESLAVARRIIRGRSKMMTDSGKDGFTDEKKTAF